MLPWDKQQIWAKETWQTDSQYILNYYNIPNSRNNVNHCLYTNFMTDSRDTKIIISISWINAHTSVDLHTILGQLVYYINFYTSKGINGI